MGTTGTLVSEIMTREVVTLLEEDNLQNVAGGLEHFRFHHIPVIDDRKVVGILSQRDILRATVSGVDTGAAARTREARFLEQTFIRDVMQTNVVTARPDETVKVAAKRMLAHRFAALPVVDGDDNLVGIVTEHDILRTIANEL